MSPQIHDVSAWLDAEWYETRCGLRVRSSSRDQSLLFCCECVPEAAIFEPIREAYALWSAGVSRDVLELALPNEIYQSVVASGHFLPPHTARPVALVECFQAFVKDDLPRARAFADRVLATEKFSVFAAAILAMLDLRLDQEGNALAHARRIGNFLGPFHEAFAPEDECESIFGEALMQACEGDPNAIRGFFEFVTDERIRRAVECWSAISADQLSKCLAAELTIDH